MKCSKKRGCGKSWRLTRGDTVEGLADAIKEGMRAFTEGAAQSDDITILVVQYKGNK